MTKATLNLQRYQLTRNSISYLLEQLILDYQKTKQDRQEIAVKFPASDEEFTVLEEIELLTVNLRGYASQIQARGWIDNEKETIKILQSMQILAIPSIAKLYFETKEEYPKIKAYLQKLDYLRLLILEYLRDLQD
jgi:hypothetical protein